MAEVKSFIRSESRLRGQLNQHLQRVKQDLHVRDVNYPTGKVTLGYGRDQRILHITVLPSNWKLPRLFRFEGCKGGRLLHVDSGEPPQIDDETTQTGDNEWRIILRWSKEALAEAAYEMTFWYMGKIGEIVYSKSVPKARKEMTPTDAGRNAAKMMLYYAILRSTDRTGGTTGHCSLQQLRIWLCTWHELQERRGKARDDVAPGSR